MASGITVNIKLDKFHQDFLFNYFNKEPGTLFSFPKGHDLSTMLTYLLSKSPSDLKIINYKHNNFEIELPYVDYKNPNTYNYLSETRSSILSSHIHNFYVTIFHSEMNTLRKIGFKKKECVEAFMATYNLDPNYYDRLIKDYQRYSVKISQLRAKNKCKKLAS